MFKRHSKRRRGSVTTEADLGASLLALCSTDDALIQDGLAGELLLTCTHHR